GRLDERTFIRLSPHGASQGSVTARGLAGGPDPSGNPRRRRAPVLGARRRRGGGPRPRARDEPHPVEPLQSLSRQAGALRGGARARAPPDRRPGGGRGAARGARAGAAECNDRAAHPPPRRPPAPRAPAAACAPRGRQAPGGDRPLGEHAVRTGGRGPACRRGRRRLWRTEATRDAIYHLALAIGDLSPLYLDEDYARRTRWGTLIAPPIIVQSMDTLRAVGSSGLPEGLPGVHSIWTGSRYEWARPVKLGDRIRAD